jgi:hypothetical protein
MVLLEFFIDVILLTALWPLGSTSPLTEISISPLTPELNPSAQLCLTRFFTGDFAS